MRVLTLTVGNTNVSVGVFFDGRLIRRTRFDLNDVSTAARFRRAISAQAKGSFDFAAIASVVPKLTPIAHAQIKAIVGFSPKLLSGVSQHTLRINYREPIKMGNDRVAAALGAHWLYPHQSAIIVDCGTATTVTALTKDGTVLGGAIIPGLSLWSDILTQRTAQLPRVDSTVSKKTVGRSPAEGIAAGIHVGHLGAIREIVLRMKKEAFGRGKAVVIGTGGHAEHFALESLFDVIEPDLVLQGLCQFAQSK
jgi:type III pantothenate kinase